PKRVAPWTLLTVLAEREGKPGEALPLMAEAEQRAGTHAEWDLVRARYWVRRGRAEARGELAKLEQRLVKYEGQEQDALRQGLACELRPTWSRVPLLQAHLYELEKHTDKALQSYQAALERGEGRLSVVRRTLELLTVEGRYAEASALLQKLPTQALAFRDLDRL